MTVALGFLAALLPASVALVGFWLKRQSEERLRQERWQSEQRLIQEHQHEENRLAQDHTEEQARLRLDAAMRAARLFEGLGDTTANPAASATGLLALTQLGRADLAVALLVDLWSVNPLPPEVDNSTSRSVELVSNSRDTVPTASDCLASVSTEIAILVINAALEAQDTPSAQLIAAELLCRNATRLDPCQSLHWPAAIDGRWIPGLARKAKLLVMEGLIDMTTHVRSNENALRTLAVRLYGVWNGDPDDQVRGCTGTLIASLIPALQRLKYTQFMQAREVVTLLELEDAADSAHTNPDGFLDRIVREKSSVLRDWAQRCDKCDFRAGGWSTAQTG